MNVNPIFLFSLFHLAAKCSAMLTSLSADFVFPEQAEYSWFICSFIYYLITNCDFIDFKMIF